MLYMFTNRRRAKDAIMQIAQKHGTDGMMVFVQDESVYVEPPPGTLEISSIMYYGEEVQDGTEGTFDLDKITEVYKNGGIHKFRV